MIEETFSNGGTFGYVKYETTRWNALFFRLGAYHMRRTSLQHRLLLWWFNAGAAVGVLLMIGSVLVLLFNVVVFFYPRQLVVTASDGTETVVVQEPPLTLILPGFNVPLSHLSAYFLALLLSGVFHEVGHAVAAAL